MNKLFNKYQQIFDIRAKNYIDALEKYPNVRMDEYKKFINTINFKKKGLKFLDAPCGSGILASLIPENTIYYGIDPSKKFFEYCKKKINVNICELDHNFFESEFFDVIGSLAGLHHIEKREPVYKEWYRILKKGGKLVIMDVHQNSQTSFFLNNFVDKYNSLGHKGFFISDNDIKLLTNIGFNKIDTKWVECKWLFSNYEDINKFSINLFGLDKLYDNLTLFKELNKKFTIKKINGDLTLFWKLFIITAHKAD